MQTIAKSTTNRKWFALVRLVSYGWALVVLYLLAHYEPSYRSWIEPATHLLYIASGVCVGRYGPMNIKIKRRNQNAR